MVVSTRNVRGRAKKSAPVKKRRTSIRKRTGPEAIEPPRSPPPDTKLQENMLALLCCNDDEAGKIVSERIDPSLFEGDYRIIGEKAFAYRKKYGKAPGLAHLVDLFPDVMNNEQLRGKARTYLGIFDDMVKLAKRPSFNGAFVRDQLDEFERQQSLKTRVLKAAELSKAGRTDEAEEVLRQTTPINRPRTLTTRSMDQFDAQETAWLWYPFVPLGELTTFYGPGDTGKSTITIDMAVRIAKGAPWPQFGNTVPDNAPKGSTLFISRENDPNSVLRPRLEAAGAKTADLRQIHFVGYNEDGEDDSAFDPASSLDSNASMEALEQRIAEIGDVKLVVIDPAPDFIGKIDNNATEKVRQQIIAPLLRIARKYGLAAILVLHVNKKEDAVARNRATGSEAWINAPRSGVVVGKNPDDPTQGVMALEKHNLSPGASGAVTFHMRSAGRAHKVVFERDLVDLTADQILIPKKGETKLDKAKALLKTRLADGPIRVDALIKEAEESGISQRTLRSAKKQMNIRSKKDGLTAWVWMLRKKV